MWEKPNITCFYDKQTNENARIDVYPQTGGI